MIDYKAWQFWFTAGTFILTGVINIIVWVGVWITNKDKARAKDIVEVKDEIRVVDTRVTRLEENQISHEDLGKVYDRINKVSDQVAEITGSIGNIGGTVDVILETLLKKEKTQ